LLLNQADIPEKFSSNGKVFFNNNKQDNSRNLVWTGNDNCRRIRLVKIFL